MGVQPLTQNNFDKILNEHILVVIDFSAKWCAPCLAFEKILTNLAEEYPDIYFGRVDIDEDPELAQDFQVLSVPSVMVLRNRALIFAESGLMTKPVLVDILEKAKKM